MANTDGMPQIIDTHVHIFTRQLPLVAGRRYAPDYDATPEKLLANMASAGVPHAMLVQPSFLGTDNSYLLMAIAAYPQRFSGIAVIEPDATAAEIAELRHSGICGVRLNLIGTPGFLPVHAQLAARLAEHRIVLQIQAEGEQWTAMRDFLLDSPGPVVIDHFGRTPPGDASGGFETLLEAARRSHLIWFKFSAPYRLPPGAAEACAVQILAAAGPDRILWGSDWPHTQFENRQTYGEPLGWLSEWVPEHAERQAILIANPARLFGFAPAAAPG